MYTNDNKEIIITLDNKTIKRVIQHVGQGIDSHIVYKGTKFDVKCVEFDIETGKGTWRCVESKVKGRFPNI